MSQNDTVMAVEFTPVELQNLKCKVFEQDVNPQALNHAEMPTDVHLVEYEVDGKLYVDCVRAHKMVDIFDPYYDKLKEMGGTLNSITSGFGRIKPVLFGVQKKEEKKG